MVTAAMLAAALSYLVPAAQAQEGIQNPPAYRIGVVDRKKVFDAYNRTKTDLAALQAEVESLQQNIDDLSDDITEKKAAYEAGENTMLEEQREELKEDIESLYRRYKTEFKRMQAEIDSKHAKLIKKIRDEIDEAIGQIGVEEDYHLIFEGDPKSGTGVLYFSTAIELTGKVIARLNGE
jgi:Skp family chaperone for outer membrane proteins